MEAHLGNWEVLYLSINCIVNKAKLQTVDRYSVPVNLHTYSSIYIVLIRMVNCLLLLAEVSISHIFLESLCILFFMLILYVPSTFFESYSCLEPVLS